jgi:hypothetical protein
MSGKKFDGDKSPVGRAFLAYFPRAIKAVADVSKFGAQKYGVAYEEQNWRSVDNAAVRYEDAVARHTVAALAGESVDPESGLLHLAHRAWDAMATLELALSHEGRAAVDGVGDYASPQQIEAYEQPCGCERTGEFSGKICGYHLAQTELPAKREFKVGDRVRVTNPQFGLKVGDVGYVTRPKEGKGACYHIAMDIPLGTEEDNWYPMTADEIEHV